jgi:hypothetical protein
LLAVGSGVVPTIGDGDTYLSAAPAMEIHCVWET